MADARLWDGGMIRFAAIGALTAAPAFAQDDVELRPAPEWFVEAVVAVTTAEQLARSCSTLSLEGQTVHEATTEVIVRLREAGFDTDRPDGGMEPSTEAFRAHQNAFLDKHGLSGEITEEMVCAAGRAEMAEGSKIGEYLMEMPG